MQMSSRRTTRIYLFVFVNMLKISIKSAIYGRRANAEKPRG